MVHYHSYGTPGGEYLPEPRAAIITSVNPEDHGDRGESLIPLYSVGLCVLNPTGMFFHESVQQSADPEPGCWSWPPRV